MARSLRKAEEKNKKTITTLRDSFDLYRERQREYACLCKIKSSAEVQEGQK